ncbi:MAG TPA: hypothetical protein VF014_07020, partial [Casimicrobiaceae bacterium]|nr:hypothetical protein [Casimicrobiaceae bacterium]
ERDFADAIRDRHAAYFEALAEDAFRQRGEREKACLDLIESEHDNLRAALDRLRTIAPERFLGLAGALGWFWHLHSHFAEGRAYLAEALALTSARDVVRARALSAAGELAAWSGDLPSARASIDEAAALWRKAGREREIGLAQIELGWGYFYGGDDAAARHCMEDSLRIAKAVGERPFFNRARVGLLQVLVALGELDRVEPMAREALADAERQDDLRSAHFAQHFLADCALIRGEGASAVPGYRRALELAVELGDRTETAIEIQGVAMAAASVSLAARALRLGGAAAAELDALASTTPASASGTRCSSAGWGAPAPSSAPMGRRRRGRKGGGWISRARWRRRWERLRIDVIPAVLSRRVLTSSPRKRGSSDLSRSADT